MKQYLWQETDSDRLNGLFSDSEKALNDARRESKSEDRPLRIIVWDARPARASDKEHFDGHELADGSIVDTSKKNWHRGLYMPENAVIHTCVGFGMSRIEGDATEKILCALSPFKPAVAKRIVVSGAILAGAA